MLEEMKVSGFSLNMYICKLATLTANDSPDVHSYRKVQDMLSQEKEACL